MVVHIHTFLQKVRRTLKSERGEANYFSTVVFIFIAVILLAFIIDLFGIISTKQELDHAADQMVKQIQLSGGINSETDSLFNFLCSEIEGAENITYSIDATYKTPTPSGITVVDAASGAAVSSPLDFSNRTQKSSILHFGKVNKLQYLSGTGLSLQSGVAYSCIKPAQSMPTIVSSKGQSNIDAIKRYFCSEYACMMVAQAAGVDYERMIAGEYKLLIEPIAYFTHNGQYYCMTATEAGLYDQMSGGNLRRTMTSLTHKNLPLSMFLEFSDLGISAWTGNTTGTQNNSDIINTLGVGIVWFDEAPPEGEIEAPDVEYRVDTDVITSVTLRTDTDLTPDNPASVTFHILGTTYRVNDVVIPAGDSQVVWVKWHTPSTPQTVTITVSVSGAYTAQDTFVAEIVDLNEHIPPDPVATDTNPGYTVPSLPNETQKLTANWGVWSCYGNR